jgi:hypothetical protein
MISRILLFYYYIKIFINMYFTFLFLPVRLFLRKPIKPPTRTVFVMGTFSHTPEEVPLLPYWGAIDSNHIISPKLGKISSIHDRACELFYQLKGMDIDYGYYHSQQYKHQQIIPNPYKISIDWSESQPLHFVCHSAGGTTMNYLLYLLEINYFKLNTSAKWVKSITYISVPHKGVNYLSRMGINEKYVSKISRAYLFSRLILFLHYVLKLVQRLNRNIIKYDYNLHQHSLISFDNDNLGLDLNVNKCKKITNVAISIANKYNIPTLNIVCHNSEKIGKYGYYATSGLSPISFMFMLTSSVKDLDSPHDGLVSVESQKYWKTNNNVNLLMNCDHLDPVGLFGISQSTRDLYKRINQFIENNKQIG